MDSEVNKIVKEFLKFNGNKHPVDFERFIQKVALATLEHSNDEEAVIKLNFITQKLNRGLSLAKDLGHVSILNNYTVEDINEFYDDNKKEKSDLGKVRPPRQKRNDHDEDANELGKLVDEGEVPTSKSRADNYWSERVKVIFTPTNKELRSGPEIPKTYKYDDLEFLISYYHLKSIEFGNWLSQQDRRNYLSGLGLSLFDLHKILGFNPKDLSLKGKITVAFGARGRGSALAHFESDTFAINVTRYKRPRKGLSLQRGFDRIKLLTAGGGMGSFAHEYGHALDYYAGTFIERNKTGAVSDGRSLRTITRKQLVNKPTVGGLMETILDKIIWEKKGKFTGYYGKLHKLVNKKGSGYSSYFIRRNELFARAFEVYVHFKMQQKKYRNLFLAETKYDDLVYLSHSEMKKLEKYFDAFMSAVKKKLYK